MSSNVTDKEAHEWVDPKHSKCSGAAVVDGKAGIVERKRDKLAIVGFASSSREAAPFDDDEWEIVGLNQLYRHIPRADFWADLHVNWEEENVEGTDHRGWIRDCGIPVLMTQQHDDLPTSVRFPVESCIELSCDYFTSTVALLIAWAIHQGYKTIGLWGIDLIVGTEYEFQKACAEFWLGVAHGKDMEIVIPATSALLRHSHRYGFEMEPNWGPVSDIEMKKRQGYLMEEQKKMVDKLHFLDGAADAFSRMKASIQALVDDPDATPLDVNQMLKEIADAHGKTTASLAHAQGAGHELGYWQELFTLRSRGALVKTPHMED
jgi:hypothetical protein